MEGFYEAAMQLPRPLSQILCRVPAAAAEGITEIRLRAGRPVALSTARGTYYLLENGCLQTKPSAASVKVPPPEMDPLFGAVCGYSVHTVQHAVDEGYVPMAGGHRAGVCGTAFWRLDGTMGVKDVTSINIRIARQIDVPLPEALRQALCAAQIGLIVAGEPGSGKTTVLRSAAKALSEMGRRVAVDAPQARQALAYANQHLERAAHEAAEQAQKDRKLYYTLGLSAGAAAALLLI